MNSSDDKLLPTGGVLEVNNTLPKTEGKEQKGITDPFSPANTGMPVVIYDNNGNRVGNVWSPATSGLSEAMQSVGRSESTKIYLNPSTGQFSNAPISNMTFENGKIDLNISPDIKESSWYKNIFGSQIFKDVATAYAVDPTGKTELEVTNPDGSKEEKTINDLLAGFAEDLRKYSEEYKGHVDIRTNVSRMTDGALNLTDEDIDIIASAKNITKEKFESTDAYLLPTALQDYFKDYAGYNAESGSISAESFYKDFFNLDQELPESAKEIIDILGNGNLAGRDADVLQRNAESDKDYAIDLVRTKLEQDMIDIVERTTFYKDDMSDEEKARYATEYVKCFALYKAMAKDTPDSGSWTGFNLAVQSVAAGFTDGVVTAGENFVHVMGQLIERVATAGVGAATAVGSMFSFFSDAINGVARGDIDKLSQTISGAGAKMFADIEAATNNETLETFRNGLKDLGQAIDQRKDLAAQLFGELEYDLATSYANTEALMRIGKMGGMMATQILVTNPVGSAVGSLVASGVTNLTSVLVTGTTAKALTEMSAFLAQSASTANQLYHVVNYAKLLSEMRVLGGMVGFAANLYMQGVVDTFMENPSLTDALLYGQDDDTIAEFQGILAANIALNAMGEVAPGIVKGGYRLGKKGVTMGVAFLAENTTAGAFAQAGARKFVNWITLRGRKIAQGISQFATDKFPLTKQPLYTIETGPDGTAIQKLTPARRWQNIREEIIKKQEEIAEAPLVRKSYDAQVEYSVGDYNAGGEKVVSPDGPDAKSIIEKAKDIDDLIQERIELENKLGQTKRLATAQAKNRIIKGAGLDSEIAEVSENTVVLTKLSKKLGQTNLPGSFSKETGDYLNDLFGQQRLLNKQAFLEGKGKTLSEAEQAGLDALTKRISEYEAAIPSEMLANYKEVANDYLRSNYMFYRKLNDYLASDAGGNVIPQEKLKAWRADSEYGEAGEMYMPQMAVSGFKSAENLENFLKDPSRIIREGEVSSKVELFSRKQFSADVAYLDPNYTRNLVINAYAKMSNAADMTDAIKKTGRATSVPTGSNGNILKTPANVETAKKNLYDNLRDKFLSALKENRTKLGQMTVETTRTKAKSYFGKVKKRTQTQINELLGLDLNGLKRYAATLNSEEINQLSKAATIPPYARTVSTQAELDEIVGGLSERQKKLVEKTLKGGELNVDNWNTAVKNENLDVILSRQLVKDNEGILRSDFYKEMVSNARIKELSEEEALALREAKAEYEWAEQRSKTGDLSDTAVWSLNYKKAKDFEATVETTLSDAVTYIAKGIGDNPYLEQLLKEYEKAGVSSDAAKEYLIYQWMYDNRGHGQLIQKIAEAFYGDSTKVTGIRASKDAAKHYASKFRNAAESIIESKLNKTIAQLQEEGVEGLIDLPSTAARVEKYFKDITDLWGNKQIVEAWDRENGRFVYYQVDRSTYDLVTNYPSFKKANGFAMTMAKINSIARIGQITIRMASLVTQGFKDTFNAVILGGWDQLMLDDPTAYKKIAEYIGQDVVDAFRKEMTPGAWKDFLATAEWEGLTIEEAIAKAEINDDLLRMKIEGGSGTSAGYFTYRQLYDTVDDSSAEAIAQVRVANDTWKGDTKKKWKEAYSRAREAWYNEATGAQSRLDRVWNVANGLHDARERFLRKQVYRQNFMVALSSGKSLSQARNYAQYIMDNATTNFSRGVAWGDNIVRSIPYFGAMINGATSMIRLLEVDPLGVAVRFTTDLVIPVVGLTVMSLQDPRDAEIYRNIPEYEKDGNMHWVVNGQKFSIPLPEELAKFILPIRHAVEKMAGANDNAWHELVMNDILNMPTVPLNAVMMLDEKKLSADPSVGDRLSALAMDMFNTMAPNAARTAYIAATGKDPYTGENYGKMRWYQDANGEYQLMAESDYGFVNDMANIFKSWGIDNVNAVMAEGLLSSLLGVGTMDLFEGIRDLSASVQEGSPDAWSLVAPSAERAARVLNSDGRTDQEQADIAWYALYNEVKEKKNELLSPSGKLAKYAQDIDMAKDLDTLNKKTDLYDAEVHNWQSYVLDKVKQYQSQYGNYFNRSKFASSLSMMTANLSIDRRRDSDAYYDARALAVETMYDAGFTSPSDRSVFGYTYRDPNTGKVSIRYTDPLVISLSENLFWHQTDDAVKVMEDTIELSGLKQKYNEEIYPKYSQYMDAKDYTSANKLAADWDVEVMKAMKPIIDEYTVDELLSKSSAIDLLDNYIIVPNTEDAMGKGRFYSSSTGLNKRRGFAQSYAKKIYNAMKGK